jgi:hypothetical protein
MPSSSRLIHVISGPLLVVVVLLLLLGVTAVLLNRSKSWLSRIRRKELMTENEKAFFLQLQRALTAHLVFPQVSFAAFITDDGKLPRQKRWAVRSRFDRKIADFVVCDRQSLNIIALIELDDRTHTVQADRQRDAITSAAGYRTIRFQSKKKPTEAEITALFQQSDGLAANARPPLVR